MSDVKQCDRCKVLVKQDFGIGEMVRAFTFGLYKQKPITWDFCQMCTDELKNFFKKEVENNGTTKHS